MNRLLIRGAGAVNRGDINSILQHLTVHRADVFSYEINQRMVKGATNQLRRIWETMPSVKQYGMGNWLDLFAIRIRLPNFYGPEQTYLDGKVVNYMPYAQPMFLNSVFTVPVVLRENGVLLRALLNRNCRKLSKYPLAKDDILYPYGSTVLATWIWSQIKHLMGLEYSSNTRVLLLEGLSEYIQDMGNSTSVRTAGCYDYPAVKNLISQYYSGNKKLAGELDWWLTFEMWRQVVYSK